MGLIHWLRPVDTDLGVGAAETYRFEVIILEFCPIGSCDAVFGEDLTLADGDLIRRKPVGPSRDLKARPARRAFAFLSRLLLGAVPPLLD